jgi:hypothetical protein
LFDFTNIGVNWHDVLDGVGKHGRSELLWVSEDFSPYSDSLGVRFHTLAVTKVDIEALEHLTNNFGSFDDISDILLLEVTDSLLKLELKSSCIFQADLDLIERVVLDESLKKPSDKLLDLKNIGSSKRSGIGICLSGSAVLVSILLELSVAGTAGGAVIVA